MKNSILTLLLVVLSYMAYSQKSYLDNNPEWYVTSTCAVPLPCIAVDDYNLRIGSDTLVNGILYKKIESSHEVQKSWNSANQQDPNCNTQGTTTFAGVEALIRQEGEKLFIYARDEEHLLFDFGLQVGDTIPESYITRQTDILVIDSIAYTVYNGDSLKKFILNSNSGITIVEGIGSNRGLLNPIGDILECGHRLNCYKNGSNETISFDENGDEIRGAMCNFSVSVNEIENKRLKLYPNPASNYLLVESTQGSLGSIEVYNLQGKKLNLALLKLSEKIIRIDLNHLNTGVYFIKDVNIGKTYKVVKH